MNETRLKVLVALLVLVVAGLVAERVGLFGGAEAPVVTPPEPAPPVNPRAIGSFPLHELTTSLPDTPAGQQLAWGMHYLNLHGHGLNEDGMREHIAASVLESTAPAQFLNELQDLAQEGPYAFVGHIQPPTPYFIHAAAAVHDHEFVAIVVETEPTPPHRITQFRVIADVEAPVTVPPAPAAPAAPAEPAAPAAPAAGSGAAPAAGSGAAPTTP